MRNCCDILPFCSWHLGMALSKMRDNLCRWYSNNTGSAHNNSNLGQMLKELRKGVHVAIKYKARRSATQCLGTFFFVFFFYRFVAFLALLSVLVVGVVHLCSVGLSAKLRALVRGRKPALFPTQCTLSVYLQTNICCS